MNKIEINIKDLRKKFCEKLDSSGWLEILGPIIDSDEFEIVIYKLKNEVENGRRFTPKIKDLFRAFEECPYDELKVIMIGQDPYPQLGIADGIAFSCSKTGKLQPSLRYIFKELNPNQWDSLDPDLKRWSNQGILMLNTAFTVQIGKIGSHYDIWKPITNMILSSINENNKDIPTVLLGKKAEEWHLRLHNQIIFKVPHPASAAYRGSKWDSKNIFQEINIILNEQNKRLIFW